MKDNGRKLNNGIGRRVKRGECMDWDSFLNGFVLKLSDFIIGETKVVEEF